MHETEDDLVQLALAAAVLAPSPHNTQPWLFHVDGDRIDVLLDPTRVLPVTDPNATQARLAVGAALFNMAVTVRRQGRSPEVVHAGRSSRANLVASLRFGGPHRVTDEDRALFGAIERRHSNRRPFLDRPVPRPVRAALHAAAREHRAELVLLDSSPRYDTVASLVRRADLALQDDPAYRAELARWTGLPSDSADGVPAHAAGPPTDALRVLTLRAYPRPDAVAARAFEQQPLLAVVCVRGRTLADQVVAGMAMQHVLLAATARGLSTSFVSQAVEVEDVQAVLRAEFRAEGEPYTVLRLGYGYPVRPTPRRPHTVLTTYSVHNGPHPSR